MTVTLCRKRLGKRQLAAVGIYVLDDCHEEFKGLVMLDGADLVWLAANASTLAPLLIDAVNSADVDSDRELREALGTVARAVYASVPK